MGWLASFTAHAFEAVIESHAGDWAGGGKDRHIVAPDADVEVVPDSWGFTLYAPFAAFSFSAADRLPLSVGAYPDAQRHQFQEAGHPGLDVGVIGGCNRVAGSFTIYDIAFDGDGRLVRLAVDGVQYCEGGPRPLFFLLRYGPTTVPLYVPKTASRAGDDMVVKPGTSVELDGSRSTAADGGLLEYRWKQLSGRPVTVNFTAVTTTFEAPRPIAEWEVLEFALEVTDAAGTRATDRVTVVVSKSLQARTTIRIESEPGDYLGQGETYEKSFPDEWFFLDRNNQNGIDILINNLPPRDIDDLALTLAGYGYGEIGIGSQNIAYRFAASSGKASLDASLGGRGCSRVDGRYVVHDIGYNERGYILRLAMDFVVDCDGTGPLTGYLRYKSVIPIKSRVPLASGGDDLLLLPGQVIQVDADTSWPGRSPIVERAWRQRSGQPLSIVAGTDDSIFVTAPTSVPPRGSNYSLGLRVRNDDGMQDTDRVSVHVLGDAEIKSFAYVQVDNPAGDRVFGAGSRLMDLNTGGFLMRQQDVGMPSALHWLSFYDQTDWTFWLRPGQEGLSARTYPRMNSRYSQRASLTVSGDGRGVHGTTGSMVIHAISYDTGGRIASIAFDFRIRNDGGPWIVGAVRYNTAVPFDLPPSEPPPHSR